MKPKTWKDLRVDQFIHLWKVFQDNALDDIDKQVELLSTCLSKSKDYILDLPLSRIKELNTQYSFLDNMPKEGEAKDFWAGGYKWKVEKNFTKLSASDYISLSEYVKRPDGVINNLPEILYMFCKPRYFIKKPSKDKCIACLNKASIGDAYSLALFFCHLIIVLTGDTKDFLVKEMTENLEKMKNKTHLVSNGAGI